MSRKILVVAAHADDEALGCGGTIVKHIASGDEVRLVLMADGVHSRPESDEKSFDRRIAAAKRAQDILGISEVTYLNFPDNQMDKISLLSIVRPLEEIISHYSPEIVYTHHSGDLNIDHRITQQAVMTACRPQPEHTVREIYGFEVISSTEWAMPYSTPFIPSLFVDISSAIATKILACEAYSEEMRASPHSRSIAHVEVLAKHRGYSIGFEAAEAFVVYRILK